MDSVRKHMNDKRHGKMVLEGDSLVEFAEFYDYSASYPDTGLFFSLVLACAHPPTLQPPSIRLS